LGTIEQMLAQLGNPHRNLACIHIAGTNGKGSVAATITAILQECGYKVGLYTSPHLERFNERIQVDGRPISDRQVVEIYNLVNKADSKRQPTFFELTTAMALTYFARRQVDWATIETGMGGRLDATNIIQPRLTIITNISLEHKEYLGNTIAAIAHEKAGIIKAATPLVTGVRQPQALEEIKNKARQSRAPLYRLGSDFRIRRTSAGRFNYYGLGHRWRDLQTPLQGRHQQDNAALALAGFELVGADGSGQPDKHVRRGLQQTHWPGRLDILPTSPRLIIDGAHNLAAVKRLAEFLRTEYASAKLTFILGVLDDKPYLSMFKHLLPLGERLILTRPQIYRALNPQSLVASARHYVNKIEVIESVAKAIGHALETTAPSEAICIAGSLYLVGEARSALNAHGVSLPAY
jgi:dihydrofolate synthase/folylpolyglutamate synthase